MMRKIGIWVAILLVMGCTHRNKNAKPMDTPTSGSIRIAVDESLKPLAEAEVNAFQALYKDAKLSVSYVSEAEAISLFLSDSVRLAVVTRGLSADEEKTLTDRKTYSKKVAFAKEGIALVINNKNPDSLLQWSYLKAAFKGETSVWKNLKVNGKPAPLEIVFDNPNSGIVKFLKDSLLNITQLPPYCFSATSNEGVIDYVSKKENAIGLIGSSWISDGDDETVNKFLSAVHVASVADSGEYFQPYQAYVARGDYKLTRHAMILSREHYSGLGSGFMAFVASDKGQRVVLKLGLVPVTMPVRLVQVNRTPL